MFKSKEERTPAQLVNERGPQEEQLLARMVRLQL